MKLLPTTRWIFVRLVVGLCLLPVMGCCLVNSMIYPAPGVEVPEPPPLPLKSVMLEGKYCAWIREPRTPISPVVVWCHGNAENLELMRLGGIFDELSRMDAGVLALDYPGYGRSVGKPSEEGAVASAVAALREARKLWPGRPVVLVGWSLGSAVAIQSARVETPDKLVVISPFTSIKDMGLQHYNFCLVSFLTLCTSDTYDSLATAPSLVMPILVIHGVRDEIIPVAHGVALSKEIPGVQTMWVEGAGHNDILGFPEVWGRLRAFIEQGP